MDPPVLWHYSFSNFNEKVRWALDYKSVPHVRRTLMPGSPRARAFSRGGGTVPVLDLDGERLVDSTRIIAALEARFPDPPLYPADPDERERALELEEFFDEHAGHDLRRVAFYELREHPDYVAAFLSTDQPPRARRFLGAAIRFPGAMSWANRRYRINASDVDDSRPELRRALDRITDERQPSGYLVGSTFSVADLTAASLLYPLAQPPEFQYELPDPPPLAILEAFRDHPAVEWIRDMFREHRGPSLAIAGGRRTG
jgi:glutathione S-transferase